MSEVLIDLSPTSADIVVHTMPSRVFFNKQNLRAIIVS